jgi:HlyD family secretion protein
VDSFPSGEFGYIRGTITSVGSDALPPNQLSQQYRFPATITLKEQNVQSGIQKLNLQSGMSVSANIKLRSRPVITVLSDMFTKQLDGVKRFR